MDHRLADLLKLLQLERLEVNLFRGESRDIGNPQVFGGQVLGQALTAASATVKDRIVHSLHAYFLRRGDCRAPIVYHVDQSRDGHSFSSRRVTAIQNGEQIFNMAASFQVMEAGFDHQIDMPDVPPPESLVSTDLPLTLLPMERVPARSGGKIETSRPFEFRLVPPPESRPGSKALPARRVWFRAVDQLPDDEALHRQMLAYVSDYNLLDTSMLPHGTSSAGNRIVMASIDHAMWFHRPLRVDDWLLYDVNSPSASGARGFARASVFARDGRLVASTAQEGLIRIVRS